MLRCHPSGRRARARVVALAIALFIAPVSAQEPARLNLDGLRSATHHDRFIIKYRDGAANTSAIPLENRAATTFAAGTFIKHSAVRRMATGAHVVHVDRKLDQATAEAWMRKIAEDPAVEHIEVDVRLTPDMLPDDPGYARQWGVQSGAGGIRADQAWDIATGRFYGRGIIVAVVDSGITKHEDLDANILPGYDFMSEAALARDGDGRDADPTDLGDWMAEGQCGPRNPPWGKTSSWHGTHIAGTIAAVANNGKGVAGVAHNAKIVPVRVTGPCGGPVSDITDGIMWAAGGEVPDVPANPYPAKVINISLGIGGACSENMQKAIDFAVGVGATIVTSAGNNGVDASGQMPANCQDVIVVTALTEAGHWDARTNHGAAVDIAAPGISILSTTNEGMMHPSAERNALASKSGTSMAAAHVSGIVALMQERNLGTYSPFQVEGILKESARRHIYRPAEPIGSGMADARAALWGGSPQAVDVKLVGSPIVGRPVRVEYRYYDPDGDSEGRTSFQWYRAKPGGVLQIIQGAVDSTYVPKASDVAYRLAAWVTPRSRNGPPWPSRGVEGKVLTGTTVSAGN